MELLLDIVVGVNTALLIFIAQDYFRFRINLSNSMDIKYVQKEHCMREHENLTTTIREMKESIKDMNDKLDSMLKLIMKGQVR